MDIGLYMLKFPFRKMIGFLLPLFKNSNPNLISIGLLPIGLMMALCYMLAFRYQMNAFFLVAALLGFVRMIVATLDGLVAVTYNKSTTLGDVLNRVTPEICDILLYPTIFIALGKFDTIAIIVMAMLWAVIFFGLLGAPSGCPVQSVGPTGQTDRLAALMFFSFLQFLNGFFHWGVNFFDYFFLWLIFGGVITLFLRFTRTFKAAKQKDQSAAS